MTTRRAVIEKALIKERVDLWADLYHEAIDSPWSIRAVQLVARIRRASEALGYPTRWQDVPVPVLTWYARVEDVPSAGLYARDIDWHALRLEYAGSDEPDLLPPPPEETVDHRRLGDPTTSEPNWRDPDGTD